MPRLPCLAKSALILAAACLALALGIRPDTAHAVSTWTAQYSGTFRELRSVDFVNSSTGWVVGEGGTILKTVNGGTTWTKQNSGTAVLLRSVDFVNSSTGWVVGEGGTILKTVNGGTTWTAQNSGKTQEFFDVAFVDANTGWAVGTDLRLKTINGGATWTSQIPAGYTVYLYSVAFTSASSGCAVGYRGSINRTVNGGTTWTGGQSTVNDDNLFAVTFVDANSGWAVGDSGTILKTANGGTSWNSQNSGKSDQLFDVAFTDANTGWVLAWSGHNSTMLKTVNGGTTWASQPVATTGPLFSIVFTDANTGWAVGRDGTILHFAEPPPSILEVHRFYNTKNGVHFYTASTAEKDAVLRNLSGTYRYDGVAYTLNTSSAQNSQPLHRFYNFRKGFHFYTASDVEKDSVIRNLSGTYKYEGVAYKVSPTLVTVVHVESVVWRFFNKKTGSHFYTHDGAEMSRVMTTLSDTYAFEGKAFWTQSF